MPRQGQAAAAPLSIRLVVLDVGGTIVEERGDVPAALIGALGKRGITASPAEINQWRGASKREVVRRFVTERKKHPDGERDQLFAAIYTDFSARIIESDKTVKGIPGAEDAFRAMRKMGLTLATSAGFDGPITSSILGWLGGNTTSRRESPAMMLCKGGRRPTCCSMPWRRRASTAFPR